ncbi:class I SAM-dependent methyltransferase [bacterium]|nr:class I SAM-dependent methyltransferase [bacterium]
MKKQTQHDHLDLERFLDYEDAMVVESRSLTMALTLIKPGSSVLDIGGASGMLLSELLKRSKVDFQANLFEVDNFYKDRIKDKRINFVKGSILGKDGAETYDIVLARQILHHLIGGNFERTRRNQTKAIQNLWKLVKPQGHLILEEETNNNKFAGRVIFYGSKLAKLMGLKIKSLEVGRVVVRFMAEKEIMQEIQGLQKSTIKHQYFDKWAFTGLMKATNLMNHVGVLFLAVQKDGS